MKKDKAYVLKMVKEHDVRFIRLWFTDVLGFLKTFVITVDELEGALDEGMGFDGSRSRVTPDRRERHDRQARPHHLPDHPWRPKENAVAMMFADVLEPDGTPARGIPGGRSRGTSRRRRTWATPSTSGRSSSTSTSRAPEGKPEILTGAATST